MAYRQGFDDNPDPCRAKPRTFRYRLLGGLFLVMGLVFCLAALMSFYYLVDDFLKGYTAEAAAGLLLFGLGGLAFLGLGRFMLMVMPSRDAMRLRDLREACLWYMYRRSPNGGQGLPPGN